MSVYKANYKYKLLLIGGSIISMIFFLCSILEVAFGNLFAAMLFILIFFVIIYFLFFIFAKEISIDEVGITYKTLIKTINLNFSQIKSVKPFYTSRALTLAGGDKTKAAMLCAILQRNKPYRILLFGNAISSYKELYSRILASIGQEN